MDPKADQVIVVDGYAYRCRPGTKIGIHNTLAPLMGTREEVDDSPDLQKQGQLEVQNGNLLGVNEALNNQLDALTEQLDVNNVEINALKGTITELQATIDAGAGPSAGSTVAGPTGDGS